MYILYTDIKIFEKVQRSVTKIVPELKKLSLNDGFMRLNLTTLEERRTKGDPIHLYKIKFDFNRVKFAKKLINAPKISTRSSLLNMVVPNISKTAQRENFFTYRTIPIWNKLPASIHSATSVNKFKNRLDKHFSKV